MVSGAVIQSAPREHPDVQDDRMRAFPTHTSAPARTQAQLKASEAWQSELWVRWPREECWPAKLDIYEAAAYLRVSPDTIRRAVIVARDGRARLAHQRLGAVYRIRKSDLDTFGAIQGRVGRD